MKKPLIDVVFASEKRKKVLLLLQDGAKEMNFILEKLNTNRQSILPQIRILEEHYLVTNFDDSYELTTIGKLVIDEIIPMVGIFNLLDTDIDYWGTHKLDFMPAHLLKRLNELNKCKTETPPLTEIHSIQKSFHEASMRSKSLYVISKFLFPNYVMLFRGLFDNNVDTHFIVSSELFDKLQKENDPDFEDVLQNKLLHFFVYSGDIDLLSFGLNDECLLMRLFPKKGENDNMFFTCTGSSAHKWGKELYEYYLGKSKQITSLS